LLLLLILLPVRLLLLISLARRLLLLQIRSPLCRGALLVLLTLCPVALTLLLFPASVCPFSFNFFHQG
jgi:hypothetical protein